MSRLWPQRLRWRLRECIIQLVAPRFQLYTITDREVSDKSVRFTDEKANIMWLCDDFEAQRNIAL